MSASHHDREEETLIAYFQQMLAEVDDEEFDGELHDAKGKMKPTPVQVSAQSAEASHAVLESANADIKAAQDQGPANSIENPVGGFDHISTRDMIAAEMAMADDIDVIDNPLAPINPIVYSEHNSEEYKHESMQESKYGFYEQGGAAVDPAAMSAAESMLEPQLQEQPQQSEQSETTYAQPSDSLQRLLASIDTSTDTAVQTQVSLAAKIAAASTTPTTTAVAEPVIETKTETKTETKVEKKVETKVEKKVETKVETKVDNPVVAPAPAPAPVTAPVTTTTTTTVKSKEKQIVKTPEQLAQERMSAKLQQIASEWRNVDLGEQFQVLFFLVQGVRFAVPLIDLGGIFECDKITQLFGKPSWFMGITDIRGAKINIVDTLRWVMPEIGDSPDKYPYLISLGKSQWSIGCDVLEGNRTLSKSQIRWREIPGSRPWLAGIVTSDKCALLHVGALISLFEAGADIDDLNRDLEARSKAEEDARKAARAAK